MGPSGWSEWVVFIVIAAEEYEENWKDITLCWRVCSQVMKSAYSSGELWVSSRIAITYTQSLLFDGPNSFRFYAKEVFHPFFITMECIKTLEKLDLIKMFLKKMNECKYNIYSCKGTTLNNLTRTQHNKEVKDNETIFAFCLS